MFFFFVFFFFFFFGGGGGVHTVYLSFCASGIKLCKPGCPLVAWQRLKCAKIDMLPFSHKNLIGMALAEYSFFSAL